MDIAMHAGFTMYEFSPKTFLISVACTLVLSTVASAQQVDTDGDGLLDLLDVSGFAPSRIEAMYGRRSIQDLDGATQFVRASYLDLAQNEISGIEQGDFEGQDNLRTISLDDNQISSIEGGAFDGLPNLWTLLLANNEIAAIEAGTFNGLDNLATLLLTNNQIATIGTGTFHGLHSLTTLDIASNELVSLDGSDFDGLFKLQRLQLSDNRISAIESDAFEGLPLHTVDLRGNHIQVVEAGDFEGLSELDGLFLGSNRIARIESGAFGGLARLNRLDLSQNELTSIRTQVFDDLEELTHLDLSSNDITAIQASAFDGLQNLSTLDLSFNPIDSIEKDAFREQSNLRQLYMDGHRAVVVADGAFAGLNKLQSLRYVPGAELNLAGATFDSMLPCTTYVHIHDGFCVIREEGAPITSLVLDDAILRTGSFTAIVDGQSDLERVSLVGLTFNGPPARGRRMRYLLELTSLRQVTVDTSLYELYRNEFDDFAVQAGKSLIIVDPDCSGDGTVDIFDTNCTLGSRVRYFLEDHGTLPGDADGTGGVNLADFQQLMDNFGETSATYTDGDFNTDGIVDFTDFLILSGNYGQGGDFARTLVAVPEPDSFTVLMGFVLVVGGYRRSWLWIDYVKRNRLPKLNVASQRRSLASHLRKHLFLQQ